MRNSFILKLCKYFLFYYENYRRIKKEIINSIKKNS